MYVQSSAFYVPPWRTVKHDDVIRFTQIGSALERFLNADEVLGLWREEEALEDQMQDGDDVR